MRFIDVILCVCFFFFFRWGWEAFGLWNVNWEEEIDPVKSSICV